ncbi:facilitated trehalose transporter Tret1-like isoform X2 [Leptopilina boulardi]|nr:facilitated trehalose transporter Tret1-like isoform X2 [Leptopilina boulardi]
MNQGSWIVSIFNFGGVFGFLLCPILVDRLGRKRTLLFFAIPQIISWILIILAKHVYILYIARFICGIGCWASFNITTIYLGELSNKNIRGTLINISSASFNFGTVICVTCGAFLHYDTMNIILLIIPTLFLLTYKFLPESPYFYIRQKEYKKAATCLIKLHGTNNLKYLEEEIKRINEMIIAVDNCKKHIFHDLYKKHRKGFIIVLVLKLAYALSGSAPIASYTQEILSYSNFSLSPEYSSIVLMFVIFLFSILISPFSDLIGRRLLTICCGIMCALSLAILGLFFFVKFYLKIDVSSYTWIPLFDLIIFNLSGCLGIFVMPTLLASEVFPMEVKSIALCIVDIFKTFSMFLVKLSFKNFANNFGFYSVFWSFSLATIILNLIAFFIMPETKGKTLEQVQLLLS